MADEKGIEEDRAAFRGEDKAAEVEGHLRVANPEKAARGEDESPEVEGHMRAMDAERAARNEDDAPDDDNPPSKF